MRAENINHSARQVAQNSIAGTPVGAGSMNK